MVRTSALIGESPIVLSVNESAKHGRISRPRWTAQARTSVEGQYDDQVGRLKSLDLCDDWPGCEISCRESGPHRPHAILHHLVVGLVAAAAKNTDFAKFAADLRGFLDGVALTMVSFGSPGCEPRVTFTIITRELDQ